MHDKYIFERILEYFSFLMEYSVYICLIFNICCTLYYLWGNRCQQPTRGRARHTRYFQPRSRSCSATEISSNADGTVRVHLQICGTGDVAHKRPYIVVRSRSGTLYGCYEEEDKEKLESLFNCKCFSKEN